MSILVLVPVALAKHPHKRNVREKGHSSRTQSILVGKSTWQEPETVVYIMPMTQKQRKGHSSVQQTSLFIQSRIPVREWSLHSRWYFPTQSTWYNSPPWLWWFQIFSDWQLRDSVWTQHLPNCPFHCFNSGRTRTSEDLLKKLPCYSLMSFRISMCLFIFWKALKMKSSVSQGDRERSHLGTGCNEQGKIRRGKQEKQEGRLQFAWRQTEWMWAVRVRGRFSSAYRQEMCDSWDCKHLNSGFCKCPKKQPHPREGLGGV